MRASGEPKPSPATSDRIRMHLPFLDGLRGLAALYVVLFHLVFQEASQHWTTLSPAWRASLSWMGNGRYAVAVFIVISGYCLMLPVARTLQGHLPGGVGHFFRRRARRILPPYYAALGLTLLLIAVTYGLKRDSAALSVFDPGNLVSHLLLAHHLNPEWAQTIDPPMWSVGVEWHIYLLFPTLLLPLWRRAGSVVTVLGALTLGLLPHFLLPEGRNFDWARPWYLGLFAMGMAGAVQEFSPNPRVQAWRDRVPWGLALVLGIVAVAVAEWALASPGWAGARDILIGAAAAVLLVYCARRVHGQPSAHPWVLRLLETRWTVGLGLFSYSLYLLHLPAWWLLQPFVRALHLAPVPGILVRLLIGVPWVLALSYVFYLLVERRYSTPQGARREGAAEPKTGGAALAAVPPASG